MNNSVKIGAGVVALYLLYHFLNDDDKSGGTTQDMEFDESKLTYPENQYKIFADGIEAAIWGTSFIASWWEDDEAIASILKQMRTKEDVYQLITEYGVRYVGAVFNSDGGNLVQMIQEYLDDDLKRDVNADYRAKRIDFMWP